VPLEQIHLYGVVDGEPATGPHASERLLRVRNLVEKPKKEDAPSNLSITGRYVLPPEIFSCLERTTVGSGGEIQLTDGLRLLAKETGLLAYRYQGRSYDAGDKFGFLKATVEMALKNEEFGEEFRIYLKSLSL
jgi:UTP--glucose-1-phosphate uridylyltransferase